MRKSCGSRNQILLKTEHILAIRGFDFVLFWGTSNAVSIQPRTRIVNFVRSPCSESPGQVCLLVGYFHASDGLLSHRKVS